MIDSVLIERITRRIVERFDPKRVILFGSRARGGADAGSDIDLFIEMESDKKPRERALEVISLFGIRKWSMDVFVYTPEEADRLRKIRGTLASIVDAEGEILYEKA